MRASNGNKSCSGGNLEPVGAANGGCSDAAAASVAVSRSFDGSAPVRDLIALEMSFRPSAVARLMGLDAFRTQKISEQKRFDHRCAKASSCCHSCKIGDEEAKHVPVDGKFRDSLQFLRFNHDTLLEFLNKMSSTTSKSLEEPGKCCRNGMETCESRSHIACPRATTRIILLKPAKLLELADTVPASAPSVLTANSVGAELDSAPTAIYTGDDGLLAASQIRLFKDSGNECDTETASYLSCSDTSSCYESCFSQMSCLQKLSVPGEAERRLLERWLKVAHADSNRERNEDQTVHITLSQVLAMREPDKNRTTDAALWSEKLGSSVALSPCPLELRGEASRLPFRGAPKLGGDGKNRHASILDKFSTFVLSRMGKPVAKYLQSDEQGGWKAASGSAISDKGDGNNLRGKDVTSLPGNQLLQSRELTESVSRYALTRSPPIVSISRSLSLHATFRPEDQLSNSSRLCRLFSKADKELSWQQSIQRLVEVAGFNGQMYSGWHSEDAPLGPYLSHEFTTEHWKEGKLLFDSVNEALMELGHGTALAAYPHPLRSFLLRDDNSISSGTLSQEIWQIIRSWSSSPPSLKRVAVGRTWDDWRRLVIFELARETSETVLEGLVGETLLELSR